MSLLHLAGKEAHFIIFCIIYRCADLKTWKHLDYKTQAIKISQSYW